MSHLNPLGPGLGSLLLKLEDEIRHDEERGTELNILVILSTRLNESQNEIKKGSDLWKEGGFVLMHQMHMIFSRTLRSLVFR